MRSEISFDLEGDLIVVEATVVGHIGAANIQRLVELATLGVRVPAVYVNVADPGYGVDGVLGMNFLLDFNLEIRPAERRILVEKIAP